MRQRTQKFLSAVVFANVVSFVLFQATSGLAGTNDEGQNLDVLVFNYSKASHDVLSQAERETSRIFRQSRIHLVWTQCSVQPASESAPACVDEPVPGQIRLRILGQHLNYAFPGSIFGFAQAPVFASVYYESALRLAQRSTNSESDVSIILGCLIAHEVGHLLLGHNHHTVNGIMQGRWDIKQIQQLTMGALAFTPEDSKLMLANAQLRANASMP